MKTIAFRIAATSGAFVGLAILAITGIRLISDGPVAMLPGGPMSGPLVTTSFPGFDNPSGERIELQVDGWRPSSRTVLGFLHNGHLYVPSVRAEDKWWPEQVLDNPDVLVRHRGKLYPRRAKRVTDPLLIAHLRQAMASAESLASTPEMIAADTTWYFQLDPR
jgi:hypothetical protein